jgi:uroporphyrinogen-III synthase
LPSAEAPTPVLLAVAANAGDTIAERLADRVVLQRLDVYRTVPCSAIETKQALSELAADAVLFASPSAVAGFVNRTDIDVASRFVAIGPSTSKALRSRGLDVAAEAARPNLEGLLEAL